MNPVFSPDTFAPGVAAAVLGPGMLLSLIIAHACDEPTLALGAIRNVAGLHNGRGSNAREKLILPGANRIGRALSDPVAGQWPAHRKRLASRCVAAVPRDRHGAEGAGPARYGRIAERVAQSARLPRCPARRPPITQHPAVAERTDLLAANRFGQQQLPRG